MTYFVLSKRIDAIMKRQKAQRKIVVNRLNNRFLNNFVVL